VIVVKMIGSDGMVVLDPTLLPSHGHVSTGRRYTGKRGSSWPTGAVIVSNQADFLDQDDIAFFVERAAMLYERVVEYTPKRSVGELRSLFDSGDAILGIEGDSVWGCACLFPLGEAHVLEFVLAPREVLYTHAMAKQFLVLVLSGFSHAERGIYVFAWERSAKTFFRLAGFPSIALASVPEPMRGVLTAYSEFAELADLFFRSVR
jgi:N-acetylglutamate synthase-like GNAT family acetyltransferase